MTALFHITSSALPGLVQCKVKSIPLLLNDSSIQCDVRRDAQETYPENQSICRGFEKLKKYYELSDDCRANYIAAILNPNQKLKFYDDNDFEDNEKNHIKNLFSSNFIY